MGRSEVAFITGVFHSQDVFNTGLTIQQNYLRKWKYLLFEETKTPA